MSRCQSHYLVIERNRGTCKLKKCHPHKHLESQKRVDILSSTLAWAFRVASENQWLCSCFSRVSMETSKLHLFQTEISHSIPFSSAVAGHGDYLHLLDWLPLIQWHLVKWLPACVRKACEWNMRFKMALFPELLGSILASLVLSSVFTMDKNDITLWMLKWL